MNLNLLGWFLWVVAGVLAMVAFLLETATRQSAQDDTSKDELRRERSDLIARRDLSSNWSDAWREQWVADHWHDYDDPAALHAHGDELQERLRSGYYHRRALDAGRLLRLTPPEVTELEDMYRRDAEEPLKQYALVITRKNRVTEAEAS